MREKRSVSLVLTSSILVAICANISFSHVTSNYFDKYVAVVGSAIPVLFSCQISSVSPATVWIPEEDAVDTDGSVTDEFAEVAHVFARPENRVVRPKDEDEITQQPVPWTSLKNEWKIYQKVQDSKRKSPEEKLKKKKNAQTVPQDDESSEENDTEEDDTEDEEEDEPEGRSAMSAVAVEVMPSAIPKAQSKSGSPAKAKEDIPLAFYGQQNQDDDEKDYFKDEASIFKKKQKDQRSQESEEEEDDDASAEEKNEEKEAASVEDYADYAQDDDDDDDDSSEKKKKGQNKLSFEDIPLAIREMILNDLANQNNGSGYHPNLTPQVTGGNKLNRLPILGAPTKNQGGSSASVEDDGSKEENSSEEEEDDNNAAEVVQPPPNPSLSDFDPTPPPVRPTPKPKKKGEDDSDEVNDEDKGKGKGKKGKKKKGKKGWGGWGQLHVHHPGGWGGWKQQHHHKEEHGWGWDPEKHDGLLEQLVRGSTWERVLKYYHWKRDQSLHEDGYTKDPDAPHNIHTNSHPPHQEEHPGHEIAPGIHIPEGDGWGWEPEGKIKKIVKKAFKGSFWERAVHTYAKYKENQHKNPKKPVLMDLDSEHLDFNLGR